MSQPRKKVGSIDLSVSDADLELGDADAALAGSFTFQIPLWGTGGAITPEGTVDGVTWDALTVTPVATGTAGATISAAGIFRCDVTGLVDVRLRVSSTGTGSVDVFAEPRIG